MITNHGIRQSMRDMSDYFDAEFAALESLRAMTNLGLDSVKVVDLTNRQIFELLAANVHKRRAAGLSVMISEADFCALGLAMLSEPEAKPFAKAAA